MEILELEILLLLLVTYSHANTESFSYFSKSKINPFTCDEKQMSTISVNTKWECINSCTRAKRCRRLLYCSSDTTCRHYQFGTDCRMSGDSTSCICFKKNIGCYGTTCTCPPGYHGNRCQLIVRDCEEAKVKGDIIGKLVPVTIKPNLSGEPIDVVCFFHLQVGTVILSRDEDCTKENFNRSLVEYEQGFGSYYMNSWIGFNKLLAIMTGIPLTYALQITLTTDQEHCFAKYANFQLNDKTLLYSFISTGTYFSTPGCGDSMLGHPSLLGRPFSTYDFDHTGANRCPAKLGGGWWFHNSPGCTKSFLTGTMNGSGIDNFWKDNFGGKKFINVLMTLTRM